MTLKLHELKGDPGKKQKRQRVGRGEGSRWGKTCGRGHKGAGSRSGKEFGPSFEGGQTPLIRRVPKFGFSNISFRIPRAELTLEKLNRFEDGASIDLDVLKEKKLVAKSIRRVKVIATGKLEKKDLKIKLQGFSKGARSAIEAQSGTCEVVES